MQRGQVTALREELQMIRQFFTTLSTVAVNSSYREAFRDGKTSPCQVSGTPRQRLSTAQIAAQQVFFLLTIKQLTGFQSHTYGLREYSYPHLALPAVDNILLPAMDRRSAANDRRDKPTQATTSAQSAGSPLSLARA